MNNSRNQGFQGLALICLLAIGFGPVSFSQSLDEVSARQCVYGDCENGRGSLELTTPYGKGEYRGRFRNGEFDGHGRLQVPISFTQTAIYVGAWVQCIRSGRGTYWNGTGHLYIGQWQGDQGQGKSDSFFDLHRGAEK